MLTVQSRLFLRVPQAAWHSGQYISPSPTSFPQCLQSLSPTMHLLVNFGSISANQMPTLRFVSNGFLTDGFSKGKNSIPSFEHFSPLNSVRSFFSKKLW
jgi:hypothetical protein